MTAGWVDVDKSDVQVGDQADHWSGTLDPRPVGEVRRYGRGHQVKIDVSTTAQPYLTGWLPASLYTYRRRTS